MTGTYDPDGSLDNTTTVVIDGSGAVTNLGGSACTDCELDADFGYEMDGPLTLQGSICLEASSSTNGVCGDGTDSEVTAYTVNLYNDAGQYLGATTTDAAGNYTFTNLITDTYYVAMGTVLPPIDDAALTTTASDTPASSVTETSVSVYQQVTVNTSTASSDGGSDTNSVEGVDFAYVLTIDYDYGDLPASYSTSLLNNPSGPRHSVPGSPTLYLGALIDSEDNGVPSGLASSDGADEDGVVAVDIANWTDGANGGTVEITVNGSGYLIGWFDFNDDGDLTDDGEMVISQLVSAGQSTISFDVPAGTISGGNTDFYSRFRLFAEEPLIPTLAFSGATTNGEVEDYLFTMTTLPEPSIDLRKYTNGQYVPTTPGPSLTVGDPVTWTYVITNTGNVTLTDVTLTDDQLTVLNPLTSTVILVPGEVISVTATGTAIAGQYANTATVTATNPYSMTGAITPTLTITNPSHYFGLGAGIVVTKYTNGSDADTTPGPSIAVGDPVTWTYVIENTGNATLTDVTLTDDQLTALNPLTDSVTLLAGEIITVTATGTADRRGSIYEHRDHHRHPARGCPGDRHQSQSLLWHQSGYHGGEVHQWR